MANKIQFKRGLKGKLPVLDIGEPAFCTDTKQMYVGSGTGNVEIATSEQLNQMAKMNNWLEGKTVNFLGDSITAEGAGKVTYVTRVGELLGCNTNNYAIGGRAFTGTMGFWSMVKDMATNADVNVIAGGVNDYLLGVPIGTKDSLVVTDTLYGALEKFAIELISRFPNAINVMITPLKALVSASGASYSQEEVVKAIYFIANKYNFMLIDLYSNAPNLNPNIPTLKTRWQPDGIHPNQAYVDKFLGMMIAQGLLNLNSGGTGLLSKKDFCRIDFKDTQTLNAGASDTLVLYGNPQTTNNNMIGSNSKSIVIQKHGLYYLNIHSIVSAINAVGNVVCGIGLNGDLLLRAVFNFNNLGEEHKTLNLNNTVPLNKGDILTFNVFNNLDTMSSFTGSLLTAIEQ